MGDIETLRAELVELQSQMAFQDDTVQALNEAIASQQQEIMVLRRQLELLKQRHEEQAATSSEQDGPSPVDERPPHY
ncbi:MAG: SlyX family protein [Halioglobus sp.]